MTTYNLQSGRVRNVVVGWASLNIKYLQTRLVSMSQMSQLCHWLKSLCLCYQLQLVQSQKNSLRLWEDYWQMMTLENCPRSKLLQQLFLTCLMRDIWRVLLVERSPKKSISCSTICRGHQQLRPVCCLWFMKDLNFVKSGGDTPGDGNYKRTEMEDCKLRIRHVHQDWNIDVGIWSMQWDSPGLEEQDDEGRHLGWSHFPSVDEQHSPGGSCYLVTLYLFHFSEGDFESPHYQSIRPKSAENVFKTFLSNNQRNIDNKRSPVLQEMGSESRLELPDGSLTSDISNLQVVVMDTFSDQR